MSPKLSSSGETLSNEKLFEALDSMREPPNAMTYIKLAIQDEQDMKEAADLANDLQGMFEIFVHAVGNYADPEVFQHRDLQVKQWAMESGFRYTPRYL